MIKLFRFTDRATGEERGICYKNTSIPFTVNPDWSYEEIQEKDKQHYIDLQRQQWEAKKPTEKEHILKVLGLTEVQLEKIKKL